MKTRKTKTQSGKASASRKLAAAMAVATFGIVLLSNSSAAFAQKSSGAEDHHAHAASAASSDMVEGEVRKVDKGNGKITIRHGELKSLDMPAMTMVYRVSDPAMLDKLSAGDKIRLAVEKREGQNVVTTLERATDKKPE